MIQILKMQQQDWKKFVMKKEFLKSKWMNAKNN